MMRSSKWLAASAYFVLAFACLAQARANETAAWPQFRGPHGNGSVPDARLPLSWSESSNVVWKTAVRGRGRSSPAVLGERIWLTAAIEQGVKRTRIESDDMQTATHVSHRAVCVDRGSGKALWETTLTEVENPPPVHWLNSWATPSPAVEKGRLYCDFGAFGTACLDSDTGEVLWRRELVIDHQVGPGSSPILFENLLVLVRDGRDAQYVTALDKHTGRTVWKTDRPPIEASSGNLKKSFCTPLVIEAAGQRQLIAPGPHWAVSYHPRTGEELWRVRHGQGFSIGTSPAWGEGLVFFGTGCFKAQLWAVRADGKGDVTSSAFAWKTLKQVPVMSSPVVVGRLLFWVSDDGMATCADTATGEVAWQERLGGPCLASPLATTDQVYFFRQDAKTIVVKTRKTFHKLGENMLEGTLIATPAAAGRSLYLRTDSHLYRLEEKP